MNPRALPYLLSAPALLLFVGVVLVPIAMTAVLSFYDWSMTRGIVAELTFKNWQEVFGDPYFYGILLRTLRTAAVVVRRPRRALTPGASVPAGTPTVAKGAIQ